MVEPYVKPRRHIKLYEALLVVVLAFVGLLVFDYLLVDHRGPFITPRPRLDGGFSFAILFYTTVLGVTTLLTSKENASTNRLGCMLVTVMVVWAFLFASTWLESERRPKLYSDAGTPDFFVQAQEAYRQTDWDRDGVFEYAKTMTELSAVIKDRKLAAEFAKADFSHGSNAVPHFGRVYKILSAQGAFADGGAKSYLDDRGNMTQGFAFVLIPRASDGTFTGETFIFKDSSVYRADLEDSTGAKAGAIPDFDPDPDLWRPHDWRGWR